jgi:hypothetical protein
MSAFPQPDNVALTSLRALDDRSCYDVPYLVFTFRQTQIATDLFKCSSHDRYVLRLEISALQKSVNRHGRRSNSQQSNKISVRKQRLSKINKPKLVI